MSEDMKFIVEKLNGEPFNRKLNLISFDALEPLQLLQVLNDVLSEIDAQHKVDLRDEAPEDTAVRMFSFLRVLKYKPKTEQGSLNTFRVGLVQGDKLIVHPVLCWLLQRMSDLKKRAYLGRFLVKIDVPLEILQDDLVQSTFGTYESLLAEFKDAHKATERIKSSSGTASEVRKDIATMEEERRQIRGRIQRQKKKVHDNVPNHEVALVSATARRQEQERERELAEQKVDQKNQLLHIEQRFQRARKQLRELQTANMGCTAEALIQQLEEENIGNAYTVKEKLPKELESRRQLRDTLKQVVDEPALTQDDFDALESKLRSTSESCQKIHEMRMQKQKPGDDKLSLFRQQAAVVSRKKASAAQTLAERRDEIGSLEQELEEKKSKLDGVDKSFFEPNGMMPLMTKVRNEHDVMRMKKREIQAVQSENGIRERTLDLLKEYEETLKLEVAQVEEEHGTAGIRTTQSKMEKVSSKKTDIDEKKERLLKEMSVMAEEMKRITTDKKDKLTPLLASVRSLRAETIATTAEWEETKKPYDSAKAACDTDEGQKEVAVRSRERNTRQLKARLNQMQSSLLPMCNQLETATMELKHYTAGVKDQGEKDQGESTFRETQHKAIQQLEAEGKELKQTQKDVRTGHSEKAKQKKMWEDLHTLMEAKRSAFKTTEERRKREAALEQQLLENEDRLVM